MIAKKILHIENTILGEGPVWDDRSQRLWWVDIEPGFLNCFDPTTNINKKYAIGQRLGAAVPCEDGSWLLAMQDGFAFFDPITETLTQIDNPEWDKPANRFNDGKCDPAGRLWAGTMQIEKPRPPVGSLYCLDTNLTYTKKLSNICISNGLAWTKDHQTMYYIDTLRQNVQAFHYDIATGNIREKRIALSFDNIYPDGMCIDENDHLWIAFYGSGMVVCYNPETGEQLATIKVPAKNTTSCTFGGPALDTLYITSAAEDGDVHGGALFAVKPGVRGLAVSLFRNRVVER